MTIRSGGRARERPQAHPAEPATYDEAWQPDYAPRRTGRRRGGRRGGSQRRLQRLDNGRAPGRARASSSSCCSPSSSAGSCSSSWSRPSGRSSGTPSSAGRRTIPPRSGCRSSPTSSARTSARSSRPRPRPNTHQVAVHRRPTARPPRRSPARLQDEGFLADRRAFIFIATQRKLTDELQTGSFILRTSMTPDELVTALLDPEQIQYVEIALRTGLRLEQITAKLETIDGLTMDPADFYELAKHPTAEAARRLPVAEGGPARRARRSRASSGRRRTGSCPTRRPRS